MLVFIYSVVLDSNDREFMEELYQEFEPTMFVIAGRYASDWADQQDIVQATLVKLVERIPELRALERCLLTSYIAFTTRRTAIFYLRAQKKGRNEAISLESDAFTEPMDSSPQLEALVTSSEHVVWLWRQLSEVDHILLEGKYIFGVTDEDLAYQLKCRPDSIRMKLTRARRRALEMLSEKEEK